jgi:hypothetical protein
VLRPAILVARLRGDCVASGLCQESATGGARHESLCRAGACSRASRRAVDGVTGLPRAALGQAPAGRLVSAALALGLAMLQGHRPIIVFALHSWGWTDAMIKSALLRKKKVGSDGVCGNTIWY